LNLVAEATISNITTTIETKSQPAITYDSNVIATMRKPSHTSTSRKKKKRESIQQENISDEDESNPMPLTRRMPQRQRSESDDEFLGDDDDYEKLAHKRRLIHHGKITERKSIISHIKKLVGVEDDDDDNDDECDRGEGDDNNKATG
jgi:hypothetical protein